jgi:predicted nucleotidyltransferase
VKPKLNDFTLFNGGRYYSRTNSILLIRDFIDLLVNLDSIRNMNTLSAYKNEINALCANHKVKSLYAFGSVLTPNLYTNSDIDLIVDFKVIDLKDYADNYFNLKFSLQDLLNRPVDLLEEQAIKNPYFKQVVNQTKELVYG